MTAETFVPAQDDDEPRSKLPMPRLPEPAAGAPKEVRDAWTQYMIGGLRQNQEMFKVTLEAFLKPYWLTIWLYGAMIVLGMGLFLVAAFAGLSGGDKLVAMVFAGLSVTTFLAFFIQQPLRALEQNLELITWLGVAFNTYWTRLLYMADEKTTQSDLKAAEEDFRASVDQLIARHAELSGKRPGGGTSGDGKG